MLIPQRLSHPKGQEIQLLPRGGVRPMILAVAVKRLKKPNEISILLECFDFVALFFSKQLLLCRGLFVNGNFLATA